MVTPLQLDAPTLAAHLHGLTTGIWQWNFSPQDPKQSSPQGAMQGSISAAARSSDQQAAALPSTTTTFDVTLITSPALLSPSTRVQIFNLFQRNLQSSYELNDAWNPAEKKEEMSDEQQEGKWILLWEPGSKAIQEEQTGEGEEERVLAGFILWRFDTEECTREDWAKWEEARRTAAGEASPPLQKKRMLPLPGSAKRGPGGKGRLIVKRPKVERLLPVGYW